LGNHTLKDLYPTLFAITRKKHISVASVFSTMPFNISFRRGSVDNNLIYWHNLVARVANTRLSNKEDKFVLGLHQNGIFQLNLCTLALVPDNRMRLDMTIWKLRIPFKIKIFM
jgi:hypothetical protein